MSVTFGLNIDTFILIGIILVIILVVVAISVWANSSKAQVKAIKTINETLLGTATEGIGKHKKTGKKRIPQESHTEAKAEKGIAEEEKQYSDFLGIKIDSVLEKANEKELLQKTGGDAGLENWFKKTEKPLENNLKEADYTSRSGKKYFKQEIESQIRD